MLTTSFNYIVRLTNSSISIIQNSLLFSISEWGGFNNHRSGSGGKSSQLSKKTPSIDTLMTQTNQLFKDLLQGKGTDMQHFDELGIMDPDKKVDY